MIAHSRLEMEDSQARPVLPLIEREQSAHRCSSLKRQRRWGIPNPPVVENQTVELRVAPGEGRAVRDRSSWGVVIGAM